MSIRSMRASRSAAIIGAGGNSRQRDCPHHHNSVAHRERHLVRANACLGGRQTEPRASDSYDFEGKGRNRSSYLDRNLGFGGVQPDATGRVAYHPATRPRCGTAVAG